jgi:Gas vesicle protein.
MVSDPKPTRSQGDLAEMLEMLLDKGVVVNADVAVSVGDTELLGIELRAAIASFETAAKYGLEFPTGTDMKRVEEAANINDDLEDNPDADMDMDAGVKMSATTGSEMNAERIEESSNSSAETDDTGSTTVPHKNRRDSSVDQYNNGTGESESERE